MSSTHTNLLFHIVYSTKLFLIRHDIDFDERYLFEEEHVS